MQFGWAKWSESVHWWLSKTHPTESLGESRMWTLMWSHECSPVRTTMAKAESRDVTVRVLL